MTTELDPTQILGKAAEKALGADPKYYPDRYSHSLAWMTLWHAQLYLQATYFDIHRRIEGSAAKFLQFPNFPQQIRGKRGILKDFQKPGEIR